MIELLLLLAGPALPSAEAPVAALVEARDLLMARKHAALTALVEARQAAAAKDHAKADEFDWTLNAFRLDNAAIPGLIEDWVKGSAKSWAPILARAVNRGSQAALARGTKWASETSADQFRRMAELEAGMRADCRMVLSRNPAVCRCYVELVVAAKNDRSEPDSLTDQAFEVCPWDYDLHVEHVFGLTPRWGGSYAEMRSAIESARRRGLDAAHVKSLAGYVPVDQASLLQMDGKLDEALRVLDKAIEGSPTALLFEERAELNYRRKDSPGALRDGNSALDLAHGGWSFSARRLTRLLVARAWALHALGKGDEARRDIGLALNIAPTDAAVKTWQEYLGMRSRTGKN